MFCGCKQVRTRFQRDGHSSEMPRSEILKKWLDRQLRRVRAVHDEIKHRNLACDGVEHASGDTTSEGNGRAVGAGMFGNSTIGWVLKLTTQISYRVEHRTRRGAPPVKTGLF